MALPRPITRALSVLVFVLGLALALAASMVVAYQTAKATPSIGLLVVVVLVVFFVCILLVTGLAAWLRKTWCLRKSPATGSLQLHPLN